MNIIRLNRILGLNNYIFFDVTTSKYNNTPYWFTFNNKCSLKFIFNTVNDVLGTHITKWKINKYSIDTNNFSKLDYQIKWFLENQNELNKPIIYKYNTNIISEHYTKNPDNKL